MSTSYVGCPPEGEISTRHGTQIGKWTDLDYPGMDLNASSVRAPHVADRALFPPINI